MNWYEGILLILFLSSRKESEDVSKKEKVDKWVESEPDLERKVRDDFRTNGVSF